MHCERASAQVQTLCWPQLEGRSQGTRLLLEAGKGWVPSCPQSLPRPACRGLTPSSRPISPGGVGTRYQQVPSPAACAGPGGRGEGLGVLPGLQGPSFPRARPCHTSRPLPTCPPRGPESADQPRG